MFMAMAYLDVMRDDPHRALHAVGAVGRCHGVVWP